MKKAVWTGIIVAVGVLAFPASVYAQQPNPLRRLSPAGPAGTRMPAMSVQPLLSPAGLPGASLVPRDPLSHTAGSCTGRTRPVM